MTAQDKADVVNRLSIATAAVASFPDSIPPIESVFVLNHSVSLSLGYNFTSNWAIARKIALLAAAVDAAVSISKSGSRVRLAVEFRHNDVNFRANDDMSATNGRALTKALGLKLPSVAKPDPLVFTSAELLKAIDTLESA